MSLTTSKPGDNPAPRLFDFYHRCIDEMQATGTHDAERLNAIVEAMGDLTGAPHNLAERIQPRFPGWTFEPSEAFSLMYPVPFEDRPELGLTYVERDGALVVFDATSRHDFARSVLNILRTLVDERSELLPEKREAAIRRILERASEKLLAHNVLNPWSERSDQLPYAEAREGFAMLRNDNLAWVGFQVCKRRKPVFEPVEPAHAPRP